MARAELKTIRTAVASVDAYQHYAGVSLADAVDVICDYNRIVDDRDRRIVRNAVEHRREREQASERRAVG